MRSRSMAAPLTNTLAQKCRMLACWMTYMWAATCACKQYIALAACFRSVSFFLPPPPAACVPPCTPGALGLARLCKQGSMCCQCAAPFRRPTFKPHATTPLQARSRSECRTQAAAGVCMLVPLQAAAWQLLVIAAANQRQTIRVNEASEKHVTSGACALQNVCKPGGDGRPQAIEP